MATTSPRMTGPTRAVLEVFLAAPADEHYGFALGAAAGLASGTVHPILARLEALGWVSSRWEAVDPSEQGRPQRRYYRLTRDGAVSAGAAVTRAGARQRHAIPRLVPGAVT